VVVLGVLFFMSGLSRNFGIRFQAIRGKLRFTMLRSLASPIFVKCYFFQSAGRVKVFFSFFTSNVILAFLNLSSCFSR